MTAVDVCICTFRRKSLGDTLESLAKQRGEVPAFRVIVADNDAHDGRRDEIEELGRTLGLDLVYVHAPEANIAVARNACLDAARADWIAFIDDDEVADPAWLAALFAHTTKADILFGPVQASYSGREPNWMVTGDFHSARMTTADKPWNGYSGNVLLNREFCRQHGLRFDAAWGKSGGEDTLFFFAAKSAGARFGYAPEALVSETVASARATLRWLAVRRFRSGQTFGVTLRNGPARTVGAMLAAGKCVALIGAAALLCWNRTRAAKQLLRSSLQAGVVAAAVGMRPLTLYSPGKER